MTEATGSLVPTDGGHAAGTAREWITDRRLLRHDRGGCNRWCHSCLPWSGVVE